MIVGKPCTSWLSINTDKYLGADVGHPVLGVAKPSVTGLVFSYDEGATRQDLDFVSVLTPDLDFCVGQTLIGLGLCICPVIDRLDFVSSIRFFGDQDYKNDSTSSTLRHLIFYFDLNEIDDLFCQRKLQHSLA